MKYATTPTITCSSCGAEWTEGHCCAVPPTIDFRRYTTEALEALEADLHQVLTDRRAVSPGRSGG